jgi:hypothetical protein
MLVRLIFTPTLSSQGPKYFTKDTLTNRDERFFAAEIIRESIFHSYKVSYYLHTVYRHEFFFTSLMFMLGTAFVSVDHSDFYLSFLSLIFKDEIPYSCEVVIDAFKDKTPQLSLIEACIVVRA